MKTVRELAIFLGAFVLASALAGALGAVNLGTALSFGQIAIVLSVVLGLSSPGVAAAARIEAGQTYTACIELTGGPGLDVRVK